MTACTSVVPDKGGFLGSEQHGVEQYTSSCQVSIPRNCSMKIALVFNHFSL